MKANESDSPRRFDDWRWQLANAITDIRALNLPDAEERAAVQSRYPFFITPYWLRLMKQTGLVDGPATLQALPDPRELTPPGPGECDDPFCETSAPPVPGLVHRFPDRVLVVANLACAMRCRHCTRKNLLGVSDTRDVSDTRAHEMPYTTHSVPDTTHLVPDTTHSVPDTTHLVPDTNGLLRIRDYIVAHPAIREVLLSGGDPLLLDDDAIGERVELFAALPQIDAVRIGTRVPCTLPMRVTDALASRLGQTRKVWVNTQFNHVSEITDEAAEACAKLVDAGIPVSNQAVLLKGVNDTADDLVALFCGLQRIRVRPYYLFVCDPVSGTSHFRVSEKRAAELEEEVAARVGGLALPRFVRDVPGAPRKVPVRE